MEIWFTGSGKTTSTSLLSNSTVSNRLITQNIFTEITKLSDATLITIVKEDFLFKNNFVISLLGIFVLFFCVFVLTYVYFKCCRKRSIDNKITQIEWKAQYQSLSPGVTEPEITVQPAHASDSAYLSPAYLSPVSNRYENIETIGTHGSDVRQENNSVVEIMTSRYIGATDQIYTINEPNTSLEDQSENVYNEIYTCWVWLWVLLSSLILKKNNIYSKIHCILFKKYLEISVSFVRSCEKYVIDEYLWG